MKRVKKLELNLDEDVLNSCTQIWRSSLCGERIEFEALKVSEEMATKGTLLC